DGTLQRIVGLAVAELVGNGGQQSVLARNDVGAGVENQEVSGAVSVLRVALLESRLPEGGRLLVAQDSGDRCFAQQARPVGDSEDLRRGAHLREHRLRYPKRLEDPVI